ncbi:hypothetical protein AB4144_01930, partial [Rhizobiaceae sp. 2RAB30]
VMPDMQDSQPNLHRFSPWSSLYSSLPVEWYVIKLGVYAGVCGCILLNFACGVSWVLADVAGSANEDKPYLDDFGAMTPDPIRRLGSFRSLGTSGSKPSAQGQQE